MKVRTQDLVGLALDWAVAKCEGHVDDPMSWLHDSNGKNLFGYSPSTSWAQGGPLIEREGISWHCGNKTSWHAYGYGCAENYTGPTPLVAAMRCYVASKLGEEVDIPKELR